MMRGRSIILAAVILLAAGPASADPPPSSPIAEVTVTAPSVKKVPQLVERFGEVTSGDRLSRWAMPVCPLVIGLSPDHSAFIAERMKDIARAARIPIEPGKCEPNIVVVISVDADAVRRVIARKGRGVLNSGSRWPIDKSQLYDFAKEDGAPAHVFYLTGEGDAFSGAPVQVGGSSEADSTGAFSGFMFGPPVVQGYLPSRLTPKVDDVLQRVFVIIDGNRVVGLTLQQIAAYASMVTMAEVRVNPPLRDVDTITAMFADAKAGAPTPPDLTFWDRAYLGALYGVQSSTSASSQRSDMSRRIAHAVEVLNVPDAAPVPASVAAPAPAAPPTAVPPSQ